METKFTKYFRKYHTFTELILLLALVPFLFTLIFGGNVRGEQKIVAGVKSHIIVEYDNEAYEFETYKTNIGDALLEQGIKTYEQDEFSLSKNTRLYGQDIRLYIEKSLPIIIYDNTEKTWGRTTKEKPEEILEQNNIEFWPEDVLESELIIDPIKEGGAGQLVRIIRAPVIKIKVDGETKKVRTWGFDVKAAIEKAEVKLNPNDKVNPGLTEYVNDGDIIVVTRINYADVFQIENIDFNTIYKGSTSLALGKTQVSQNGIVGQKKNTYRVTYKDGEEVSRTLISSTITKAKRDQVVLRGAEVGSTNFGWYEGYVTSFYRATSSMVGKYLLVTNLDNGKSVKVRIIGSGPYTGPLMDMGYQAFREIGGSTSKGRLYNVMVQLID